MEEIQDLKSINILNYITEEDIDKIVKNCRYKNNITIERYYVKNASDKILGYLSDYWRLRIDIVHQNKREKLHFFIKAISRSNEAKATVVKDLGLFQKELVVYTEILRSLNVPEIKPFAATLVTALNDALVFQDLDFLQYRTRNKLLCFDMQHTLQALNTLARFHASTIIYEEKKTKELQRPYSIYEDYAQYLDPAGYHMKDNWFLQCAKGSLETLKTFSKYCNDSDAISVIETHWFSTWSSALDLTDPSSEHKNVICHRDLWNNNLMFHYNTDSEAPDDCVLVDFQAVRYHPPAGDVISLLYLTLDSKFRREYLNYFLDYYHQELTAILNECGISKDLLSKEKFLASAEEQKLWALVLSACLIPQIWIDDNEGAKTFADNDMFDDILHKNKARFIKQNILQSDEYRHKILDIFDEIAEWILSTHKSL